MVNVKLNNSYGVIAGASPELLQEISDECSFKVQGAERSELYRKRRWDGYKRLFDKKKGEFHIGLWGRISRLLQSPTVYDLRVRPDRYLDVQMTNDVQVRDYQREAVMSAMVSGQSILRVATGGGKTAIAACVISQLKCNTVFMVHTKDLLYQAKDELSKFLVGQKIGQVGDGVIDIQNVTIATMQTVSKALNVEYKKSEYDDYDFDDQTDISRNVQDIRAMVLGVDMVIWDEVHRVACDTAYEIMEHFEQAYYRVGLSASPWRDDGADLMIEAAFGAVSYQVPASELIRRGFLVRPIINRVKIPSSKPWWEDTRSYDTVYKQDVVENHDRNMLIVEHVRNMVSLGFPVLVLVQQIKHGNELKRLISEHFHPIDFVSGRDYTEKRLVTIQAMRDGDIDSLIASTIADEGLDIKRLAGLILAGGGKSSTRALQRIGRVLRPYDGKEYAMVVDFADEARYLRDHALRRKEIYLTETEFTVLET